MERWFFSCLERAAGGSVCQSRRQHAQIVVKAESSNEDKEVLLGIGSLNHLKALEWKQESKYSLFP